MHTLEQLRTGQLAGIQRLQLNCGLTEFPREIFDLADSLEILDLSGNALTSLPDDLPRLGKLRVILCVGNQFTALPEVLGACPQLSLIGFKSNRIRAVPGSALPPLLRWLILTDNAIEALPAEIGRCDRLQKLMLAGNQLRALPDSLAACTNLELLRVSANRLDALPDWLFALPKLAWLAFAGNPCSDAREQAALAEAPIASIAWDSLQLGRQLGEGASGVIYQASLREADGAVPVAVKLFKGAVTSDGWPRSELAACMAASGHPHLIPVLGQVRGHPTERNGCVMALIDPAYGNLAGPPNLDSCTRDTYPEPQRFTPQALLAIAHGIASAARHLHRHGVLHGDLYGHNILHREDGDSLLGDFGAAALFSPDAPLALPLQRLEIRAYGILLQELAARCDAPPAFGPILAQLLELAAACRQPDVVARPLFEHVEHLLHSLRQPGKWTTA